MIHWLPPLNYILSLEQGHNTNDNNTQSKTSNFIKPPKHPSVHPSTHLSVRPCVCVCACIPRLLGQPMSGARDDTEELGYGVEEVENLWNEEEQQGLAEVPEDSYHRKCHASKVAVGVADKHCRGIPGKGWIKLYVIGSCRWNPCDVCIAFLKLKDDGMHHQFLVIQFYQPIQFPQSFHGSDSIQPHPPNPLTSCV